MIRLGLYITLAILIALGAVWFANHPGQVLLIWQGWEIQLSVAVLWLLIFLYTLLCGMLVRLYFWFRVDNPLNSPKRQERRRAKGRAELDLGWSALAVGDRAAALKHGKKAHGLLPGDHGPLRLLIPVAPDKDREKYLEMLMDDPASRMIALKYRLEQELEADNFPAALAILDDMQTANPGNPWISQQRFDILTRLGQWSEATTELDRLVKAKVIDKAEQKHLRAVLCYSAALEADLAGDKNTARTLARKALKYQTGFSPARDLLARHSPTDETKTAVDHWACTACGNEQDKYAALCPACHRFGTLKPVAES